MEELRTAVQNGEWQFGYDGFKFSSDSFSWRNDLDLASGRARESRKATFHARGHASQQIGVSTPTQFPPRLSRSGQSRFVETEPAEQPLSDDEISLPDNRSVHGAKPPDPRQSVRRVSLSFHTEEPKTLDTSNLVPVLTLGSAFILTKKGARLKDKHSKPVANEDLEWDPEIFGPRSTLYKRLIHWTSKSAAVNFLDSKDVPSDSCQSRVRQKDLENAEQRAKKAKIDSQEENEIAEEKRETQSNANTAVQYWKVWKIPEDRRKKWRKFLRPRGKIRWTEPPLKWHEAVQESSQQEGKEWPQYLIQIPLAFALFRLRTNKVAPSFTLCSSPRDVIRTGHKQTSWWKRGEGSLPVYSIPGVWVLMPSSLGLLHMSPYFLSKQELYTTWEAVKKIKLKSFLDNRVKKRRRSAEFVQKEMGKWAADRTGLGKVPPSQPPETPQSENEPPELKALLQDMGMSHPSAQQVQTRNPIFTPLKFMTVALCGAAILATDLLHLAQNKADQIWFNSPAGSKGVLGHQNPVLVTKPLADVIKDMKRHNRRSANLMKFHKEQYHQEKDILEAQQKPEYQIRPDHTEFNPESSGRQRLQEGTSGRLEQKNIGTPPNNSNSTGSSKEAVRPEEIDSINESDRRLQNNPQNPTSKREGELSLDDRQEDSNTAGQRAQERLTGRTAWPDDESIQEKRGTQDLGKENTEQEAFQENEKVQKPDGSSPTPGSSQSDSACIKPSKSANAVDQKLRETGKEELHDVDDLVKMGWKVMRAAEEDIKQRVKSMTLDAYEVHDMLEKFKDTPSLSKLVRRYPINRWSRTEVAQSTFLPGLCKIATSMGLAALRSGIFLSAMMTTSSSSIPLIPGFQPLNSPPGVKRWLLQIPKPLVPSSESENEANQITGSTRADYVVVNADMNKATGRDKDFEPVPQTVLKGLILIGEIGWDAEAEIDPLPNTLSIGIGNASSLDTDIEDWP